LVWDRADRSGLLVFWQVLVMIVDLFTAGEVRLPGLFRFSDGSLKAIFEQLQPVAQDMAEASPPLVDPQQSAAAILLFFTIILLMIASGIGKSLLSSGVDLLQPNNHVLKRLVQRLDHAAVSAESSSSSP